MAMLLARTLITKQNPNILPSIFNRAASTVRLRPLLLLADLRRVDSSLCGAGSRGFSTRPSTSSLNDPSPNWNNRPPKETILLEGCDFEHWLIVLEKPEEGKTRDEIIDSYIKTAAQIIGCEEEARKKIYSVSTKHYFAFGVIVSEEDSYKFKELPGVRWVLPDSYLDVRNKDYGGEPFINGEAVPYDPKYHEEWVRNNARANERSRRNDRPRNFDRTRNFERRRENTQAGNYNNPGPNVGLPPPNSQNPNPNVQGGPPPNFQSPNPNMQGGSPQNFQSPNPNMQGGSPPNFQSPNPNMQGGSPPNFQNPNPNMQSGLPNMQNTPNNGGFPVNPNMQNNAPSGVMPPNQHNVPSYGNMPYNPSVQNNGPNPGGMPPRGPVPNAGYANVNPVQNNGGFPPRDGAPNNGYSNNVGPNAGYANNTPNMQNRDSQFAPNNGGMPYPSRDGPGPIPNRDYQNSYVPPQSGNAYQVRDIPGRDNQ